MGRGDWLKMSYEVGVYVAKNVKIPSYRGRGINLLKKPSYDI